jgi:transcription elongation factor S-II
MTESAVISETELVRLLALAGTASGKAENGDAAEEERAVDALKVLGRSLITSALLLKTDAGKTVKKLSKHENSNIKVAANATMEAWKECVRQEQLKKSSNSMKKEGSSDATDSTQGNLASAVSGPDSKDSLPMSLNGSRLMSVNSMDSLGGASTPSASKLKSQPKRSGDITRDKIRDLLAEAIATALSDEVPTECDPCRVAVEVEEAMYKQNGGVNQKYKAKYRTLAFNLKDPNNPDLRLKVSHPFARSA